MLYFCPNCRVVSYIVDGMAKTCFADACELCPLPLYSLVTQDKGKQILDFAKWVVEVYNKNGQ